MSFHPHGPGRLLTLRQRLQRLNDGLADLGRRLRESIATVIGSTIAEATSDAVRRLLDKVSPMPTTQEEFAPRGRPLHDDHFDDQSFEYEGGGWPGEREDELPEDRGEDGLWSERYDDEPRPEPKPSAPERSTGRIGYALTTAMAAGTWWLNRHKPRRPILTAVAVAVAAGITAFFAGPAAAAGLSVASSVGGLLLTADMVGSATVSLAGLAG